METSLNDNIEKLVFIEEYKKLELIEIQTIKEELLDSKIEFKTEPETDSLLQKNVPTEFQTEEKSAEKRKIDPNDEERESTNGTIIPDKQIKLEDENLETDPKSNNETLSGLSKLTHGIDREETLQSSQQCEVAEKDQTDVNVLPESGKDEANSNNAETSQSTQQCDVVEKNQTEINDLPESRKNEANSINAKTSQSTQQCDIAEKDETEANVLPENHHSEPNSTDAEMLQSTQQCDVAEKKQRNVNILPEGAEGEANSINAETSQSTQQSGATEKDETEVNALPEPNSTKASSSDAGSTEFISDILRGISTSNVVDTSKQQPEADTSINENHTADEQAEESSPNETIQLTEAEQETDQKYRKEQQPFLQHVACIKLKLLDKTSEVPLCRECLRRNEGVAINDIYCRFQEFRRLQYTAAGEILVAGFPNPYTDPVQEDINIWQPDDNTEPTAGYMDVQVCRYILLHVGDQFCYLWRQEYEALKLHENKDHTIAWKKIVPDMREICDVCETTLFNYHWTCSECGFGVCPDCFRDRKEQRQRQILNGKVLKPKRGRDAFHWMLCSGAKEHKLSELMLTQIIAGDSLQKLGKALHEVRILWKIPQKCDCLLSHQSLPDKPETALLNEIIDDIITESRLNQQTALSSLATKETHKQQRRLEKFHSKKMEFARKVGVDFNPGRVFTKETLDKDPITTAFDCYEHINFLRKGLAGFRRFLPPKVMTMCHSTLLAPKVSHEWLCDGKLLRLTDPMNPDNRILFEEVWKCGQPVMVSEVAQSLDLSLWRPEAFCRDFGDKPNDLINCLNGNLVPNQPMRYFWEGFQCIKKRLLDSSGNPMLLKLKDWPPGDDFAEILPTRYADLMNGLPLPEYTLRTGNLNIASCLPKLFVPPDLGPKMYNAYGSALHPDKGTTNLHLDISDAVNIMVYVGIPQDAESESQIAAAQHAIAMGGCDFLTRSRCQDPNVMPGAIWHIFAARDADKIRDLLNRVTLEKGYRLEPDHDPIHDQSWYLDDVLRARLFEEYGVKGYSIVQCLGDAVFIPAGAPHQVQNLHNCIKVAEDFVSPENITHCYHLLHEFRQLSRSHTNHEDKLQIKNIIYHAVKDCCTILMRSLQKKVNAETSQA